MGGGGVPVLKPVKRPNNNDDESSAMLTMPPQASSSSCGPLPLQTDEQHSEKKARAQRPRSSKETAPETESVAKKKPTGKAREALEKELDMSDRVLLQADQAGSKLKDNMLVGALTYKEIKALHDKVASRLTTDLVMAYSGEWQPGDEESRGMQVLRKLKEAKEALSVMEDLVQCITGGNESSQTADAELGQLHTHLERARKANIDVAECVKDMVVVRAVQAAASKREWKLFLELMDFHGSSSVGVHSLDEAAAKEIQLTQTVKVVTNLLRVGESRENPRAKEDAFADLKQLLEPLVVFTFLPGNDLLTEGLNNLHCLCSLCTKVDTDSEAAFKSLEHAKETLESNKAGYFWRSMSLFPTGLFIMEKVTSVLAVHAKHKRLAMDLDDVKRLAGVLRPVDATSCWSEDKDFVVVPAQARWSEIGKNMAGIRAKAPDNFMWEHAEAIGEVHARQVQLGQSVEKAILDRFNHTFRRLVADVLSLLSVGPGTPNDQFEAKRIAAQGHVGSLRNFKFRPDKMNLPSLLPMSLVLQIEAKCASIQKGVGIICAALPMISGIMAGQKIDPLAAEVVQCMDLCRHGLRIWHPEPYAGQALWPETSVNTAYCTYQPLEFVAGFGRVKAKICEVVGAHVSNYLKENVHGFRCFVAAVADGDKTMDEVFADQLVEIPNHVIDFRKILHNYFQDPATTTMISLEINGTTVEACAQVVCLVGILIPLAKLAVCMRKQHSNVKASPPSCSRSSSKLPTSRPTKRWATASWR